MKLKEFGPRGGGEGGGGARPSLDPPLQSNLRVHDIEFRGVSVSALWLMRENRNNKYSKTSIDFSTCNEVCWKSDRKNRWPDKGIW